VKGTEEQRTELVQRAIGGDQAAYAELLSRDTVRLVAFIRKSGGRALRADFDADDVFQNVASTAWLNLPRFEDRGPGSFYRWLVTIAKHAIQDRWKYLDAKGRGGVHSMDNAPTNSGAREPIDTRTSISVLASRREGVASLERALDALDADERQVIDLQLLQAKSLAEIATELGIAKSTAWERLNQAMSKLKRSVGEI
jgi:RNA polymerase sigma-70 factor (ECF subfamily)